jgi:hypothetical protein
MNDLWYALQDHNKYVYHYTKAETLIEYVLPNGTLRFSRFANVNDPRESKNWFFSFADPPADLNHAQINEQLNSIIKHSYRIGCFVTDVENAVWTEEGNDPLSMLYERGHSRPRMWAQYGDNYHGACLVFNRDVLDRCIRETAKEQDLTVFSSHVEYANPPVLLNLNEPPQALLFPMFDVAEQGLEWVAKQHVERHRDSFFFLKSEDWQQEREYRCAVSSKDDDSDFYVNIKGALSGILLGDHFPEAGKAIVGKYAGEMEVSVAEMNWQNGVPQPMPTHWRLLK